MAFTKASVPEPGDSFSITDPRGMVMTILGWVLGLTGVLFAWGLAKNQVKPMLSQLVSNVTGGAVSDSQSGGAWEGW